MADFSSTGPSVITIDARDSLEVIAEGVIGDTRTRIHLSTHRTFGEEGIILSPETNRVTVYREASGKYLFLLQGYRSEESIKILFEGPDEEKSELALEKMCVLSLLGDC
jgi:hypothetical protein